ncbi:MAG: hypothetical protein RL653_590 [Pseudomonadota bacterium]|jgi:MFS family permease
MLAECITAFTGGAVTTAWGLHLGCSPAVLGWLAALPSVVQPVQLPAAWLTARWGARRTCLSLVGASRAALLLLALVPLVPGSAGERQHAFAAAWALHALLAVAGNNAWGAWMAEVVPARLRGRYFGRRTALCTVSAMLASLGTGQWLDAARARGQEGALLSGLAVLAVAAGLGCTWLMSRQAPSPHAPARLGPGQASPSLDEAGLRNALGYQFTFQLGSGLCAGYFAVYAVEHLGLGFGVLALQGAATSAMKTVAAPAWGRAVDRWGAAPVLRRTSWGLSVVPVLWLLPSPGSPWPLLLEAVVSGTLGAGHAVASFQLPLALSRPRTRAAVLARYATAGGLGWASGAALGGVVLSTLRPEAGPWLPMQGLFVVAAGVRLAASARLRGTAAS